MPRFVKYIDTNSPDYKRTFATTTSIFFHGENNVSIDFSEEYFNPAVVVSRELDSNDIEHSHNPNELQIIREHKCTVVMNNKQALEMANWIIQNMNGVAK